jgi:hypothetical protein
VRPHEAQRLSSTGSFLRPKGHMAYPRGCRMGWQHRVLQGCRL